MIIVYFFLEIGMFELIILLTAWGSQLVVDRLRNLLVQQRYRVHVHCRWMKSLQLSGLYFSIHIRIDSSVHLLCGRDAMFDRAYSENKRQVFVSFLHTDIQRCLAILVKVSERKTQQNSKSYICQNCAYNHYHRQCSNLKGK